MRPCNVSSNCSKWSKSAFVSNKSRNVSVKSKLRLLRKSVRLRRPLPPLNKRGFRKRLLSEPSSKQKLRRGPAVRRRKDSARLRQLLNVRDRCSSRDLLRSSD